MAGLYTGAKGLWGGQEGLQFGDGLSTPPGLSADVPQAGPAGNGLMWGLNNFLLWGTGNYLIWGT